MNLSDLKLVSSLVKSSSLLDKGKLQVCIADNLFLSRVRNVLCSLLSEYVSKSDVDKNCVILTLKNDIPDYDILPILRSLKLPITERGKFIILNKGN